MDTQKLIPNSESSPQPSVTSIKQLFHQEIEQTSDEVLMVVLDFLIFMRSRSSRALITKTNPSTAASLLETLQQIDHWKGDDFYECLELVQASRSGLYSLTDQQQSKISSKE
jgi:hypothetical protein